MSTLRERIKEIESEKARIRALLKERIENAVKDYAEETGDNIVRIDVTNSGVATVLFGEGFDDPELPF